MRFKPHVTVATVVQAEQHFLLVEERINGRLCLNQPAGHLEANESIPQAAERELYEETGLRLTLHQLLAIQQWQASDNTPFLRFLFMIDLASRQACQAIDPQIERCVWLTAAQIEQAPHLRSPLVQQSIVTYQQSTPIDSALFQNFLPPALHAGTC